eukprot:2910395-Lingulodinium_polyedra.AAC.1
MAAMIDDRLATGDKPEDCDFPLHVGHPKCCSYKAATTVANGRAPSTLSTRRTATICAGNTTRMRATGSSG